MEAKPHVGMPGRNGLLLVLSGPSGTGKTTVARRLMDCQGGQAGRLQRSVSVTTRPARPGEADGRDYHFVTEKQFDDLANRGELLEHTRLYGQRYGTPRKGVEDWLARGLDVLLVLEASGREQVARRWRSELVSVFLLPPSWQELERRLRARSGDEPAIARRLTAAWQEVARCAEYDCVLINDDLEQTLGSLNAILRAERLRAVNAQGPSQSPD